MFLPQDKLPTLERFNRYMVECEYKTPAIIKHISPVLIDTWWNVNCYSSPYPALL